MKIEDSNPLWYKCFATKQIPPIKDEVLMQKLYQLNAQNAIIKILFIAMAKIKMVIKSIFAVNVITNLLLIDQVSKKVPRYPRCPVCGKATFLHHDYEYYSNYRCCDKNVIILCLLLNQIIYCPHLCLNLLVK